MQDKKTELENDVAHLIDDVQRIADDVRLHLHLAQMEVRQEWDKIEPHVIDVAKNFSLSTETSRQGLEQLRQSVRRIREALTPRA
jgi:methionine synthase II (cobalamin-independent)